MDKKKAVTGRETVLRGVLVEHKCDRFCFKVTACKRVKQKIEREADVRMALDKAGGATELLGKNSTSRL